MRVERYPLCSEKGMLESYKINVILDGVGLSWVSYNNRTHDTFQIVIVLCHVTCPSSTRYHMHITNIKYHMHHCDSVSSQCMSQIAIVMTTQLMVGL